uniref:C2H2-type domain-containing protein n=1 Tax=Mycena chlorophos TaxID=658473 RepID=A0ABQ0LMZ2_MYCCL|nr:predicted protein [Mycena chlorophos]
MSADDFEVIDLTGDTDDESDNEDQADGWDDGNDAEAAAFTLAQLNAVISDTPEAPLRLVLTRLAAKDPKIRNALARELFAISNANGVNGTVVRVVPRWETCENCGESYDVNTPRVDEECLFHPGELEAEEDRFVDWDEDCHGPMDTDENRRAYPENFTWGCCESDGTAEGCVTGKHRPQSNKKRRLNA